MQALHSKFTHASLVIIPGCARLTALEPMLARGTSHPHCQHPAIPPLHKQLRWWHTRLAHPVVSRPFRQFTPYTDFSAYSDASSKVGIGLIVGESWCAYRLKSRWQTNGRSMAWAEATGFELLAHCVLLQRAPGTRILVWGDNRVVSKGWRYRRTRNLQANEFFARTTVCEEQQADLDVRYVTSANNPADLPSRGHVLLGPYLKHPLLPSKLKPFLEYVPNQALLQPFPSA